MRTTSVAIGLTFGSAVLAAPIGEALKEREAIQQLPGSSPWFRAWDEDEGPISRVDVPDLPEVPTKITLPYRPVALPELPQKREVAARSQSVGTQPWRFPWQDTEKRDASPEAARNPFLWTFDWSGAPHKREADGDDPWYAWKKDWFAGEKRDAEAAQKPPKGSVWFDTWDRQPARRAADSEDPWWAWKKDWFAGEKRDAEAAPKKSSDQSPWFVHWDGEDNGETPSEPPKDPNQSPWFVHWDGENSGETDTAPPPKDPNQSPWYVAWDRNSS